MRNCSACARHLSRNTSSNLPGAVALGQLGDRLIGDTLVHGIGRAVEDACDILCPGGEPTAKTGDSATQNGGPDENKLRQRATRHGVDR